MPETDSTAYPPNAINRLGGTIPDPAEEMIMTPETKDTPSFYCWKCEMEFDNPDYLKSAPGRDGTFCNACCEELTAECKPPPWIRAAAEEIESEYGTSEGSAEGIAAIIAMHAKGGE